MPRISSSQGDDANGEDDSDDEEKEEEEQLLAYILQSYSVLFTAFKCIRPLKVGT